MIDIEDRLPALLHDAAERTPVRPDLVSVLDATTVYPRATVRSRRPRSAPTLMFGLASAAAVTIGLVVVVPGVRERWAQSSADPAAVDAVYRTHTDVYPLLTQIPSWAGAGMTATLLPALPSSDARPVWALLARRGADSLQHPIIVTNDVATMPAMDADGGTAVGALGDRPAYLYEAPISAAGGDVVRRTVIVAEPDGGADLVISGVAPRRDVLDVLHGITLNLSAEGVMFTIGDLPAGYDVIIDPTVQPRGVASFGIENGSDPAAVGTLSIDVLTDVSDVRLAIARDGVVDVRSILYADSDDQITGWYATPTDSSVVLAWTIDPGIGMVLRADRPGITAAEAIQIAANVELTDEQTWVDAYDAAGLLASANTGD